MSKKRIFQITVDCVMYILFVLLMGYHLLPSYIHEWIGIGLFSAFLIHNILNYRWYSSLFKGKYNAYRIVLAATDILLLIAMLCCIVSAMSVSSYVFAWMKLSVGFGRQLHMASTIWAFILMSVHLGLHWNLVIGMVGKIKLSSKAKIVLKWAFRLIVIALIVYGVYSFCERRLWEEMFLLTDFKLFDYEKTILGYAVGSVSVSSVFISSTYYLRKIISKKD